MGWRYALGEIASVVGGEVTSDGAVAATGATKDSRAIEPGDVYFALRGERFDGEAFVADALEAGAAAAVCRVEHPHGPCIVVNDPLVALQEWSAHHRARFGVPVIAITGSCGKTSTKDLTSSLLASRYRVVKTQGNLNNQIGCPLSLMQMDENTERVVLEMGANHEGEIAELCGWAKPTESTITMIAPAHLEGFGSIEQVASAKAEILAALPESGVFYANQNDTRCRAIAEKHPGRVIRFGDGGDVSLRSCEFNSNGLMEIDIDPIGKLTLPLRSRALASNVLLAVAIGIEHGISEFQEPLETACRNATRFRQLKVGPVEIIDDSYNANPASMAAALQALGEYPAPGQRWALLGDMFELGAESVRMHREVGMEAGSAAVDVVLALGKFAESTVEGARSSGVGRAEILDSHESAARAVFDRAQPGDVVLVKGSRGMTMEKIIDNLKSMYDDPAGGFASV